MPRKILLVNIFTLILLFYGCSNTSIKGNNCYLVEPVSLEDIGNHKNNCEKRKNCKYIPPGSCYCPPGVKCICGGGEPPKCVPKEIHVSSMNGANNYVITHNHVFNFYIEDAAHPWVN